MNITAVEPRQLQILKYIQSGNFPEGFPDAGIRKGRSPRDGYARGFGLGMTFLINQIEADPLYLECAALANLRTTQMAHRRMNLYLLIRYYLPQLGAGSIVEFGSWKGGSCIFMAALCKRLGLPIRVFGLDTFKGMPQADSGIDAHQSGDFADVDLGELRRYVTSIGLDSHLTFVDGVFDQTAPELLFHSWPVLLAHIDCDLYESCASAYNLVRGHMAKGGYIVFDDATTPSCLGNTEAMEELVIRRDGLHAEQAWPHFVFRSGM